MSTLASSICGDKFVSSLQVIHDYPSIRQVNLICNTTNLGVVAPLGYNGLLILSCTFYAFKVLAAVMVLGRIRIFIVI